MNNKHFKINIKVDRVNLTPISKVHRSKLHRFAWHVCLLFFGEQSANGRRLCKTLREEALNHVELVNRVYFGGAMWPQTITQAVDAAYEVCRSGKNNFYTVQAETQTPHYEFAI